MGIFGNAFTGWHLLLVLVVILLIFGATKLPALAKSVGQSAKILKNEMKSDDKPAKDAPVGTVESAPAAPAETTTATTSSAPPADKS
ncbi:twin-arginine translocase TatA/TatE family subunit [Schumannella sp. 10F1B-5-1]|uniref:twin-arginine translocase TatA/TatE family subunit n=1 Tax=Schumannella sp. 10F1B-5-1 TaxID=2590780 RepID=UPI0011325617|nr:twin-arginine translocase TatA/TatE family subunit [Schumannella sp. 10F1B-5-1]TPW70920.1 twin-arginine translocase TatA/TatE family subunit [Schumannella sp. 10F1B-5-1]